MHPTTTFPFFCVQATLGAGATTQSVRAAPGVGKRLVLTAFSATVVVSSANAVDLEDNSGTVEALRIGASAPVGSHYSAYFERGLALTANEALRLAAGVAGTSVHVVAEGYIEDFRG